MRDKITASFVPQMFCWDSFAPLKQENEVTEIKKREDKYFNSGSIDEVKNT